MSKIGTTPEQTIIQEMRETLSAVDDTDSQRSWDELNESNPTPVINMRNYPKHKSINFVKGNQIAKATEISNAEKETI